MDAIHSGALARRVTLPPLAPLFPALHGRGRRGAGRRVPAHRRCAALTPSPNHHPNPKTKPPKPPPAGRAERRALPIFGLSVPLAVAGVPGDVLWPQAQWADAGAYARTLATLARLYVLNFVHFHDGEGFVGAEMARRIVGGGPDASEVARLAEELGLPPLAAEVEEGGGEGGEKGGAAAAAGDGAAAAGGVKEEGKKKN